MWLIGWCKKLACFEMSKYCVFYKILVFFCFTLSELWNFSNFCLVVVVCSCRCWCRNNVSIRGWASNSEILGRCFSLILLQCLDALIPVAIACVNGGDTFIKRINFKPQVQPNRNIIWLFRRLCLVIKLRCDLFYLNFFHLWWDCSLPDFFLFLLYVRFAFLV